MNPEANTPIAMVAGTIEIKPQVIFSLALEAALSTYGVVGIASRYTGYDMTRRDPRRGLDVKCVQSPEGTHHINVNIHVLVEYGVRINAVISSLQQQIKYVIEHSTGFDVDAVNVHVSGLHVTHED
ncbi:MAG TPA: Asp23/Gls24 family envelope stress response protein [Anaerolineae bacterium]